MRVGLIGPVPPELGGHTPGGVATHQLHLARGLAAAGVKTALLATNTAAWPGASGPSTDTTQLRIYRMVAPLSFDPGTVRALGGYRRFARYALEVARSRHDGWRREQLRNLLAYRRFLADVRPAVIHVQHPLERCSYTRAVRRIERWRTPLVVTAHSLFGEHDDATIHALMAPNLRAADRVIAVSEHIAQQALELNVEPARVRVIHSGVDVERFRPAPASQRCEARDRLGVAGAVPLVLFVGNLEPRKQVDVLLRAVAQVRVSMPQLELLVVGSGESAGAQDQSGRLVRLSAEIGLTPAVRFLGHVSEAQLLDAYAAADVFALPSSSEAQGIVALEAMACGLPVIASAVGGLTRTIDDGVTGLLVPSGDASALAARLVELLGDGARRQAIGQAARREVESRFSWSRAVDATREVYAEVAGCR